MPYFHRKDETQQEPARLFHLPVDLYAADEDEEEADLSPTEAEEDERARTRHFRFLASMGDFFGVILGAALILVLIALLISLVYWVKDDLEQSFTILQHLW